MARNRDFRLHQLDRHLKHRLREDRNQHYDDLGCPCYSDPKAIARFREQPKRCSCHACGNPRRFEKSGWGLTVQELRHLDHDEGARR